MANEDPLAEKNELIADLRGDRLLAIVETQAQQVKQLTDQRSLSMPDQTKDQTADWGRHLTPELRAHFERVGEGSVQFDVSNHRYRSQDKQYAALVWIGEKRNKRERRDQWTLWVGLATFLVALATLVATIWLSLR